MSNLNFLQEPGTAKQIESFAAAKQAKFTLFEKCDVKGKNVSPVYAFLKDMSGKVCIDFSFLFDFL